MMNKLPFVLLCFVLLLSIPLLFTACNLKPDSDATMADGIVLISGGQILNDQTIEMVANRVQRIRAISPTGHNLIWTSTDGVDIRVDEFGVVRTSRNPGREAVIKAESELDPSISAQFTVLTRGLR